MSITMIRTIYIGIYIVLYIGIIILVLHFDLLSSRSLTKAILFQTVAVHTP